MERGHCLLSLQGQVINRQVQNQHAVKGRADVFSMAISHPVNGFAHRSAARLKWMGTSLSPSIQRTLRGR